METVYLELQLCSNGTSVITLLHDISLIIDPTAIASTVGYLGIFIIIFSEAGILLGIFLPGDSLLFAAGLLSSNGLFNPLWLIALVAVAAIAGDTTGYWLGWQSGKRLLHKYPRIIKPEYIERTERFYTRWGMHAVILARFIPIVRTIVPPLAGIAHMSYKKFLRYNIIGAVLWSPIMVGLGYVLGKSFPSTVHYLLPITLGIILVSFLPFFIRMLSQKQTKHEDSTY